MDSTAKSLLYGAGGVAAVGGIVYYMYSIDEIHSDSRTPRDSNGKSLINFTMWLKWKMGDPNWRDYYVPPANPNF